jgi:spore maturation protein SpmB
MQRLVLKEFPQYREEDVIEEDTSQWAMVNGQLKRTPYETVPDDARQTLFIRILDALLDGGKSGVEVGLTIIPGVLIISTFVMMFTFSGDPETGGYNGEAYQGTELLPYLAGKAGFVFRWLFGFNASELVAFPITALGTVGAALGLIPEMMSKGIIDSNAIAVFTAMGMCWSGFLSADAATLDSLGYRHFISRSFTCTFIGGIAAGIITHWLYILVTWLIG